MISYTENATYVVFAATGSWLGAFASGTWLRQGGYPGEAAVIVLLWQTPAPTLFRPSIRQLTNISFIC